MAFSIRFNEEKNQLLKVTRGVSFEDILEAFREERLLADIVNPSQKRPNQRVYVVDVQGYAYAVPYVIDIAKQEIFLKTVYPSRVLTKTYLKEGKNEKNKL